MGLAPFTFVEKVLQRRSYDRGRQGRILPRFWRRIGKRQQAFKEGARSRQRCGDWS